jgi:hypothetical protein
VMQTLDGRYLPPSPDTDAPGDALLKAMAGLSVSIGGLATEMQTERQRAQLLNSKLRYAPIQPIVLSSAQAVAGVTTFANNELWGPKTGYFWAIQRMAAFGLSPGGDTQSAQGAVISPTTFQTIVSVSGLVPFATYTVSVTATTSGTTGAPEVNNFRLASGIGPSIILNSEPGASVSNGPLTVQVSSVGALTVTTGSATPTVASTYTADLQFSSTADELNIYRGQPAPQNFMNNLEVTSPEWRPGSHGMVLQPGDFITAQAAGLVGSPVALNFDAIIGTLDVLPYYLS